MKRQAQPYEFVAEGRPKTKGRPRASRTGRVYTPKATLVAEAELAAQYDGPKYDGPLDVSVEYEKDRQTIAITPLPEDQATVAQADIDNLLKLTLDALNGVAWNDDRQIVRITGTKKH